MALSSAETLEDEPPVEFNDRQAATKVSRSCAKKMNIGANVDFNLRTLGFFGNFTGENYGETGN